MKWSIFLDMSIIHWWNLGLHHYQQNDNVLKIVHQNCYSSKFVLIFKSIWLVGAHETSPLIYYFFFPLTQTPLLCCCWKTRRRTSSASWWGPWRLSPPVRRCSSKAVELCRLSFIEVSLKWLVVLIRRGTTDYFPCSVNAVKLHEQTKNMHWAIQQCQEWSQTDLHYFVFIGHALSPLECNVRCGADGISIILLTQYTFFFNKRIFSNCEIYTLHFKQMIGEYWLFRNFYKIEDDDFVLIDQLRKTFTLKL